MMLQLSWLCTSPRSGSEPEGDRNGLEEEKKRKAIKKRREERRQREESPKGKAKQQFRFREMTARERAQNFVAMSGFPMPLLP